MSFEEGASLGKLGRFSIRNGQGVNIFLAISFIFLFYLIFSDYLSGGHHWRQGDWLINNFSGNVRRGYFGSALIHISDFFQINLLFLVCLIQISLISVALYCFRGLAKLTCNKYVYAILLMSPAIFTVLWVSAPGGAVRKEVFVFAGLSLLTLGVLKERWIEIWLGGLLFAASFVAHEAMMLFVPIFLAILWMVGKDKRSWHVYGVCALICVTAMLALFYAIFNHKVNDTYSMCQALLDRNMNKNLCDGAIYWMGLDLDYFKIRLAEELTSKNKILFFFGYILSLIPFFYISKMFDDTKYYVKIILFSFVPFVILYFIALDWGRWISFHVFSICILTVCVIVSGRIKIVQNPNGKVAGGLCVAAVLVSPQYMIGAKFGGAVGKLVATITKLMA